MAIKPEIFKSYDVRGVYPADLNEETAEAVGRALAGVFPDGKVVVGRDMRLSGDNLFGALIKGFLASGREIDDIGLVPIDAVYFAVNRFDYGGGVMITASHNPAEYNGFKIVKKNMEWVRGRDLAPAVIEGKFEDAEKPGVINQFDIWPSYLEHIFSFINVAKIKPLKVVVDAGNGMAGRVIPLIAPKLPIEVVPLFFDLDGAFPNHPSNPLEPKSQEAITKKVVEEKVDFGVIFDGDTDRLFFIDERGNFIKADITLLLLAKLMLEREPGAGIVYNVVCSKIIREQVAAWGGRPIRSAVGFVNVSSAARANGAIMGGEISAHYSFRDNGYADSGFIAFLILLQLISESAEPFSEMVKPFQKYFKSNEANFRVNDIKKVTDLIRKNYSQGAQDELDGLTVEFNDWWFNLRPSNTEPLLRLTVEANSKELMESKLKELGDYIVLLGNS